MYTVAVRNVDTGETYELSTAETSLTVGTLKPYMNYQFTVAASTAIGQGPFTHQFSVRTPEDGKLF